jgi:hypothetical protein
MEHDYKLYNLEKDTLKAECIEKINQCEDISLMDLIKKLLEKSV